MHKAIIMFGISFMVGCMDAKPQWTRREMWITAECENLEYQGYAKPAKGGKLWRLGPIAGNRVISSDTCRIEVHN